MQQIRTRMLCCVAIAALLSGWGGMILYQVRFTPAMPAPVNPPWPDGTDVEAIISQLNGKMGVESSGELSLIIGSGLSIEEPTWFERWRQRLIDTPAQWISSCFDSADEEPDSGFFPNTN